MIGRTALSLLALALLLVVQASAASCSFGISNMNFGTVDTLSGGAVDVTATLSINCTGVATGSVRICPNIGAGSGGSSGSTRYMRNASNNPLSFGIYQDAARTVSWGSVEDVSLGGTPTIDLFTAILGSVSTSRTLYGRVAASQQLAATGSFSSSFSGYAKISYSEVNLFNCLTLVSPASVPFTAQATVQPNCLITAQNINFGAHGVLNANTDATGALSITCTPGTSYTVGLDGGLAIAGPTARRMTLGGSYVTYGLYRDAGRSQPWSMTAGQTSSGTGSGAAIPMTVYGRVPIQAAPAPGTYSDTIVATVTY